MYAVGHTNENDTITRDRKPHLVSMALKWEKGPVYLALAHEAHFDYFDLSNDASPGSRSNAGDAGAHSKDTATALSASYKVGMHQIGLDFNMKKYEESPELAVTGRVVEYKNTAVGVTWVARWTKMVRTAVFYGSASEGDCKLFNTTCSTTGLDGTMLALGAAYYLDPRFLLYVLYGKVDNGEGARYENLEDGRGRPGEDITQGAIGLSYSF